VLLLLQPGRDRELFAERLAEYEVVVGDPEEPIPEFDCCLLDTATYPAAAEELAERKAETGPHLPVLLVVGPDEREEVVRETADVADDVLPLPTSEPVLRSRVDALLRARRDSLRLDAERERFRTLAETAPNAILTIDADGVVQYANPAVEQVFGHPPESVVGEPLTMLMPPGLREAHREGLSRYLETGKRSLDWTGSRLPGQHVDGHEMPLLLSFAEHWTGGERRFTGIAQDVSEQVERERELERTVDLLERTQSMADVAGWVVDAETLELTWTDQLFELLGLPVGEEPPLDEALEFYHPEDRPRIEAAIEAALSEGEPFDLDRRVVRANDEVRWVRTVGEPVVVDGEVETFRGTIQDITERKEREGELERYETVLETVPEAAWVLDGNLEVVFADSNAAASAGLTREEMIGMSTEAFRGTLFPDTGAYTEYVEAVEAVLAGERETAEVTVELSLPEGQAAIEIGLSPLVRDGEIEGVVGLARDITARKERKRELERTVDMLDRAERIADVGGWQYDPATGELLWTEQVYHIRGLDPEAGEPDVEEAIEQYHPEDRPVVDEAFERALEEGEPYDLELRIVRPDGEVRWVRTIGEPETIEGRRVLRGAFQDIHARKQREQERERTVDQLRQTRDIADVSGWEYNPDTGEVWWDEKVWDIYGQLPSFEPTAESVMGLYTPESRERMEAAMERAVVEFEPFDIEIEVDAEPTRWVRVTGEPQVEDGHTTVVRGVVRDITERKRREEFLERHEQIVETADEPIYTLDADLRLTLVNDALVELFDRDREALLGEHVSTPFGDAHAEALGDAATKLYARGNEEPITVETVITDASGRDRYYQTTVSPKLDAEGFRGLVCVSHDVTDVTEHERRLSVLDRVLRHNLRNKMNVVLARAQDIQEQVEDEALTEAGASIESAAEELLGLGEVAREFHDALDPGGTDLVGVEDIAAHARHVAEAARASYDDATVEVEPPEHAWALAHAEFELALSELVDNAATHGGPGATVTITVETVGDEVVVRVLDDGPGIPALERKALLAGSETPLQHATGLGLWFVQWTVRNSGGTMRIDDREGGGAVVELRLPAADEPEG
jgi:PAS domain S-box-containing protein